MKIKKIKQPNNKHLKLKTIKLYFEKQQTTTKENSFQIKTHLNKIAKIIYNYTIKNKRILFLGFPANYKNIMQNTRHKIIPEYISFNGILNNKKSLDNITKKKVKKISKYTLKLLLKTKKLDLIIIYNQNTKSTIIQESYIARIPTITINKKLKFNSQTTYTSLGNYELLDKKNENNDFFFSFFKTILAKTKKENNKPKKYYYLLKYLK